MKPPVGTTFIVAASLLGVAAVAQLVAVLIYFGPGFAPAAAESETGGVAVVETTVPVEPPAAPAPEGPSAEDEEVQARMAELLEEAETLRAGPAPDAALVPLEEAHLLQPRNPQVLQELATLHERIGQNELAAGKWEQLAALGDEAGRLAEVAKARLELLRPGAAAGAAAATLSLRDQVGLQPGSSLGIINLAVNEQNDGGTPVKDLRLAVKARPGEEIDARDVKINVTFFVDLDNEITPDTTSRVQSMWFTTPVDWKDDGIEILEVKYELPQSWPGGDQPRYYGYMVNIYHRGQLQETRSDPADLQELFPPPLTELEDFNDPAFLP